MRLYGPKTRQYANSLQTLASALRFLMTDVSRMCNKTRTRTGLIRPKLLDVLQSYVFRLSLDCNRAREL